MVDPEKPLKYLLKQAFMSQDNMIKMECTVCKVTNYFSKKNKKKLKDRLVLKKYCKCDKKHTEHKETK
jgi:large subunit ribosomal protein L33